MDTIQPMQRRPITYRWRGSFPIPVVELWPLFSNSDRMDQAVGLPATTFRQVIRPDGQAVLEASATFLGLPFRWTELPFEWSFEQWFKVERVFTNAPFVQSVVTSASFTPLGPDATELEVLADFTPRTRLGGLFIRLVAGMYIPRLARLYRRVAENHLRNAADPYPRMPLSPVTEAQLAHALEQLRQAPVNGELVDRLVALLREGDEREVVRMRPFVLADRWAIDRIEVLRLLLYATRAGLVDANWDVLCPNCRVEKASFGALSELRPDVHCDVCNITYDAYFDEYVELRFSVCRDIRVAEAATYCIAGPGNLRHILAQVRVPPKGVATLTAPFAAGTYHHRVRGCVERGMIQVGEAGDTSEVSIRYGNDGLAPLELQLQTGIGTLRISNERDHEILMLVEKDAWGTQGASAALVTSLQDFRRLFSAEVLSPGVSVAIRNLTILFSDLKGSTRLYTESGDSAAYAQVRDHFDVMIRTITDHHGALVKTIGDAVMAIFLVAADGLAAALDILEEIEALNARQRHRPALKIKLGLHRGSCVAINANDVMDYFGTTVNVTARVHAQSRGGDVVVTEAMMDDPGVQEVIERRGIQPERFETTLPGFDDTFPLFRLRGE